MKKIVLILFSFLILQSTYARIYIGVSGGISVDKIHISHPEWTGHTLNHTGYSFGIVANMGVNNRLSLLPSLSITQRGIRFDNSTLDLSPTRWSINYMTADIMLAIKTIKNLSVEIGPQWAYMLSAKQSATGNSGDISDVFKKNDLLGVAGLSYRLHKKFCVSLRYFYGFIDINNLAFSSSISPEEFYYPKEYNRSVLLSFRYYLNLREDKSEN